MNKLSMGVPLTERRGTYCISCQNHFEVNDDQLRKYFLNEPVVCGSCGGAVDLWLTVRQTCQNHFSNEMFSMVGAKVTRVNEVLERCGGYVLDLDDFEVPVEAKILHIEFHPAESCIKPVAVPVVPKRKRELFFHNLSTYYPPELGSPTTVNVLVEVTWVMPSEHDFELKNLVQALEAFKQGRFSEAVIPANVAIEIPMKKVVRQVLEALVSKQDVGSFLSHQLVSHSSMFKVLLPVIAELVSFPSLPEHIKEALVKMNSNRNELAHEGRPKKDFTKEVAADFLCATFFTMGYLRMVSDHASGWPDLP